jgi:hypothetical protein
VFCPDRFPHRRFLLGLWLQALVGGPGRSPLVAKAASRREGLCFPQDFIHSAVSLTLFEFFDSPVSAPESAVSFPADSSILSLRFPLADALFKVGSLCRCCHFCFRPRVVEVIRSGAQLHSLGFSPVLILLSTQVSSQAALPAQ